MTTEVGAAAPSQAITREALERLAAVAQGEVEVLSVYLHLRPGPRAGRTWAIVLKDLAREPRQALDRKGRALFDDEVERVRDWLDTERPGGRGIAVFTDSSRGLWQAYQLPAVERDELAYRPTPHLAPLIGIVEDYERYAVALVDKERARLFTVYMGQIEDGESFEPPKRVVRALSGRLRRQAFDRLVIAGPEEATSELRSLLPATLATRLIEVIPMDVSAGPARILEATLEIERRVERDSEVGLVSDLLDAVAADGLASCDLVPTIHALELRAIRTLVVADGLRIAGSECPTCGWLEEGAVEICPIDGYSMRANDDIVDVAVRRTIVARGEIEIVHSPAARRLIEHCGGIGAVLRFRAG